MSRRDASRIAELFAESGLIQPDGVSAATRLLEAIEKLNEVSFSSSPSATNTIQGLSSIAAEARMFLQTKELSDILKKISGLAMVSAYEERFKDMNNEIAHLNHLAVSIGDLVSQACGALDAASRAKESLISKIQSLKREVEGNQTGR